MVNPLAIMQWKARGGLSGERSTAPVPPLPRLNIYTVRTLQRLSFGIIMPIWRGLFLPNLVKARVPWGGQESPLKRCEEYLERQGEEDRTGSAHYG